MLEQVWINGRVMPRAEASIPAFSDGLLYGLGAFETARWRIRKGVFRLERHRERMAEALRHLQLPPWEADMREAAARTAEANRLNEDAAVRWTAAAGENGRLICAAHMRPLPKTDGSKPIAAMRVRAERGESARRKTLNYAPCLLAKRKAVQAGCDEAILCDRENGALEGSAANLFAVRGGVLRTPPVSLPILPGVMRAAVLDAAQRIGAAVLEEPIPAERLSDADEMFLTNAVSEMIPVGTLDGKPIGNGAPGPVFQAVRRELRRLIHTELQNGP